VLAPLDAERTTGAVVVPVKELFTTTEAATVLGLSQPTLMKLVEFGEIDHVKVGTHHQVPRRPSWTSNAPVRQATRRRPRRWSAPAAGGGLDHPPSLGGQVPGSLQGGRRRPGSRPRGPRASSAAWPMAATLPVASAVTAGSAPAPGPASLCCPSAVLLVGALLSWPAGRAGHGQSIGLRRVRAAAGRRRVRVWLDSRNLAGHSPGGCARGLTALPVPVRMRSPAAVVMAACGGVRAA
jgi:excisionase family DNA binding protein